MIAADIKGAGGRFHPYYREIQLPFALPTGFYAGMIVVWLQRKNLQERFPLHLNREKDYLYFLAWCFTIGRREFQILRDNTQWNKELSEPIDLPVVSGDKWNGCYSVGMYLAGIHRSRYWQAQIEGSSRHRNRTARWFFREGLNVLAIGTVPAWQQLALKQAHPEYARFTQNLLYPKESVDEKTKFLSQQPFKEFWSTENQCISHTRKQIVAPAASIQRRLAALIPIKSYLINLAVRAYKRKSQAPTFEELTEIAKFISVEKVNYPCRGTLNAKPKAFGVNLFGYAKGELGIGEDVRTMAAALEAADIPINIIDVPLPSSVSQKDNSVDHLVSEDQPYSINLFCMTGIEMSRYVVENGLDCLNGFYNIGLWPWELEHWPQPLHHCYNLVDEIWGISEFVSKAYASAHIPVNTVPLPVSLGEIPNYNRQHWKLPEDKYLFIFSFDMNSTLTRKNPEAVVRAFVKAFPRDEEDVGLVIKVSHLRENDKLYQRISALIRGDTRVTVLATELRKNEVLSLYSNCNCYVSLHRSEGFGRALAEAQLLGMDLITTAYSGNMDFCQEPTRTANYKMLNLEENDYFYGKDQQWADVDIQHAAELMIETKQQQPKIQYYPSTERFAPAYSGAKLKVLLDSIAPQGNHSISNRNVQ